MLKATYKLMDEPARPEDLDGLEDADVGQHECDCGSTNYKVYQVSQSGVTGIYAKCCRCGSVYVLQQEA